MTASRADARRRRHRRVRKSISGTEARPRLAVFRSNRYIYAQLIDDVSGSTVAAASSQEQGLRERTLTLGISAEVGKILAQRAKQAGVSTVVFDRGGFPYHGRVQALAEAVREEGLRF